MYYLGLGMVELNMHCEHLKGILAIHHLSFEPAPIFAEHAPNIRAL